MRIYIVQVSNIIYLDSPAGVGLSYSNDTSDYNTGDLKTALDAHTFLLKVRCGRSNLKHRSYVNAIFVDI